MDNQTDDEIPPSQNIALELLKKRMVNQTDDEIPSSFFTLPRKNIALESLKKRSLNKLTNFDAVDDPNDSTWTGKLGNNSNESTPILPSSQKKKRKPRLEVSPVKYASPYGPGLSTRNIKKLRQKEWIKDDGKRQPVFKWTEFK